MVQGLHKRREMKRERGGKKKSQLGYRDGFRRVRQDGGQVGCGGGERLGGGGEGQSPKSLSFSIREIDERKEKIAKRKDLLPGFYGNSRQLSTSIVYNEGI
ncbi:hypothetical protein GOODEAATRI_029867 [Goodea atripinnis]|uniref:Uncharacterized protein n=1 Tax=Goodea atripinnis TaxID=208336 RepID=A0ABV0Q269_9TELE